MSRRSIPGESEDDDDDGDDDGGGGGGDVGRAATMTPPPRRCRCRCHGDRTPLAVEVATLSTHRAAAALGPTIVDSRETIGSKFIMVTMIRREEWYYLSTKYKQSSLYV
jgi:hypothetical protein